MDVRLDVGFDISVESLGTASFYSTLDHKGSDNAEERKNTILDMVIDQVFSIKTVFLFLYIAV